MVNGVGRGGSAGRGRGGGRGGAGGVARQGRKGSEVGPDNYIFAMNGYPVYSGSFDDEPKFVTPVMGTTYFYDNVAANPTPKLPPTDATVLKLYVKQQM